MTNEEIKAMCMMVDIGEFKRIDIAKKFGISKSHLDKLYRTANSELKTPEKVANVDEIERLQKCNNNLAVDNQALKEEVEYLKSKINLFKLPVGNTIAAYDIPENVRKFNELTVKMTEIYTAKNKKYGNSFSKTYQEYGKAVLCIRLEDKLARAKQILLNGQSGSADESVIDTLIDLSAYSIMAILELEKEKM